MSPFLVSRDNGVFVASLLFDTLRESIFSILVSVLPRAYDGEGAFVRAVRGRGPTSPCIQRWYLLNSMTRALREIVLEQPPR